MVIAVSSRTIQGFMGLLVIVVFLCGFGSAQTPISSCADLQSVNNNLEGSYVLTSNLNCTAEEESIMIATNANPFVGTLDGNDFMVEIDIDDSAASYVGLFRATSGAIISDITVSGSVIGDNHVGGLIGYASNTSLTNVHTIGSVWADGAHAGGIIGWANVTDITNASSYSTVYATSYGVGGLVGYAVGSGITDSYAKGDASTAGYNAGGLVGEASGISISQSYAEGEVYATGHNVGGLIGNVANTTTTDIFRSYSLGSAYGNNSVGGLVGGGTAAVISYSYAMGDVTAVTSYAGGLVGYASHFTVSYCYAMGDVYAPSSAGSLFGTTDRGSVTDCYSAGGVSGTNNIGGLVGTNQTDSFDGQTPFVNVLGDMTNRNPSYDTTDGGSGLTTTEMKDILSYSSIWDISTDGVNLNEGYPFLSWQVGDSSPTWYIYLEEVDPFDRCMTHSGALAANDFPGDITYTQCTAFAQLYADTDGDNRLSNSGWFTTTDICTGWDRVSCDDNTLNLELNSNGLSGDITDMSEFGSLGWVYLADNTIGSAVLGSLGFKYLFLDTSSINSIDFSNTPNPIDVLDLRFFDTNLESLDITNFTSLTTLFVFNANLISLVAGHPSAYVNSGVLSNGNTNFSNNHLCEENLDEDTIAFLDAFDSDWRDSQTGCEEELEQLGCIDYSGSPFLGAVILNPDGTVIGCDSLDNVPVDLIPGGTGWENYFDNQWSDFSPRLGWACDDCFIGADGVYGQNPLPLGFNINYYGRTYSGVFVGSNGSVTFDEGSSNYDAPLEDILGNGPGICVYCIDLENGRQLNNDTYVRGSGRHIDMFYRGRTTIDGRPAFAATWINMAQFGSVNSPLNTFQILFVDVSDVNDDVDIILNYGSITNGNNNQGYCVNEDGESECNLVAIGLGAFTNDDQLVYNSLLNDDSVALNGLSISELSDGGAAQALTSNHLNSHVDGRYTFQMRNGSLPGSTLVISECENDRCPVRNLATQTDDGTVSLSWNTPKISADDEGNSTKVMSYTISWAPGDNESHIIHLGSYNEEFDYYEYSDNEQHDWSYAVNGLTNGVEYTFTICAMYNEGPTIPVCSTIIATPQSQQQSSGGGGGSFSTDYCPNGDNSGSYYDGKCDGTTPGKPVQVKLPKLTINQIEKKSTADFCKYNDTKGVSASFTDVVGTTYVSAVGVLVSHCLVQGYNNNGQEFGINDSLKRGELYKVFTRMALLDFDLNTPGLGWSHGYKVAGEAAGLWNLLSMSKDQSSAVTQQELLQVTMNYLAYMGVLDEAPEFVFGAKEVTRGEFAKFINTVLGLVSTK